MSDPASNNLTELTVDLLSAFVSNNNVRSEDLPALISSTHSALAELEKAPPADPAGTEEELVPAVSARKSLSDRNYIVSMIDGKPYKSLKRHLTRHGMTPAEYRTRYKLPASYPMVAPAYSEQRREVAKRLGLGRKPQSSATPKQGSAPARRARGTRAKA